MYYNLIARGNQFTLIAKYDVRLLMQIQNKQIFDIAIHDRFMVLTLFKMRAKNPTDGFFCVASINVRINP